VNKVKVSWASFTTFVEYYTSTGIAPTVAVTSWEFLSKSSIVSTFFAGTVSSKI